jgi:hypothetical protein
VLSTALLSLSCSGGVGMARDAGADGGPGSRDAERPDARASGDASADPDGASAGGDAGDDAATPLPPLRIAVVSDLNGSYGSTSYADTVTRAVDRVLAWEPDLVLSTGDMVAGQRAGLDYRAMWSAFHAAVSDRLAGAAIPFAVTPGNHDASGYATYAGERAIFVSEWTSRKPDVEYLDDSDYPLRYSFTVGPALFVSLDATTVAPLGGEQMTWLEAQLAAGAEQPVKIVYGHVPLYPFAIGRETEVIGDPEIERIANEHGVTALISGHHHAYYPGRRGDLRLVGTACLGSGPRALIGTSDPSPRSVLLLEIADGELRTLDAWSGAAYDTVVDRTTLPPSVGPSSTRIDRDDL